MIIKKIRIHSENLEAQRALYVESFGLPEIEYSEDNLVIQVGHSIIEFERKASPGFYHFAFNIPGNKVGSALKWLSQRVDILRDGPDELIEFSDWNAHAMYFHDADGNIVEFIGRHDLDPEAGEKFDVNSIRSVSEMGIASNDVATIIDTLKSQLGISQYSGDQKRFAAMGDENGLFILVNPELKDWFPTDEKILAKDCSITVQLGPDASSQVIECESLSIKVV